jgi:biopolymer transport protein ExbD
MKLREKPELSGELGMGSMADILFILLIFFMMVSTLVNPSALNLSLPGTAKTAKKPVTTERMDDITITASGTFLLNGLNNQPEQLKMYLERMKMKNPEYKVGVSPVAKAPVEKVVQILDMTQSMGITSVLHADVIN